MTPEKFIIQGFHGSLPLRTRDSFTNKFTTVDANTWSFTGDWNTFVRLLGQKFLAYHLPEKGEWHIYVTSYSHFNPR